MQANFLVGSQHVSFSDFKVLPIFGRKDEQLILNRISLLALAFLEDRIDEAIATVPTIEYEETIIGTKADGKPKRKLSGNVGDVIVQ